MQFADEGICKIVDHGLLTLEKLHKELADAQSLVDDINDAAPDAAYAEATQVRTHMCVSAKNRGHTRGL